MIKEININDINGIRIGHAQDVQGGTGCTAIICPQGAAAGVDVRGGGPASRETELLRPEKMVEKIHCVMLSGGSAYGLAAGDGAMEYLEERGIGFDTGIGIVPIVCGASLFDLVAGDPKCRPDKAMGYAACVDSERYVGDLTPAEGNAGAGTGATVGKYHGPEYMMKSGIGIFAVESGSLKCAAVAAVNALGDVLDAGTQEIIAGMLDEDKASFADTAKAMVEDIEQGKNVWASDEENGPVTNTTLVCVITNATLSKAQCGKLAQVAHDGLARSIRPVHTGADGDTVFTLATCETEVSPDHLGVLAQDVVAEAVKRAVLSAEPAYGIKAASDL